MAGTQAESVDLVLDRSEGSVGQSLFDLGDGGILSDHSLGQLVLFSGPWFASGREDRLWVFMCSGFSWS